jgi:hypothetical protein
MRLRIFSPGLLVVLIMAFPAAASDDPHGKVVRAPDMPIVAQNQTRPHFRAGALCDDCGEPGIEDPNWTPGACNCSRRCDSSGLCYLAAALHGCKANAYGGGCSDCSTNCV